MANHRIVDHPPPVSLLPDAWSRRLPRRALLPLAVAPFLCPPGVGANASLVIDPVALLAGVLLPSPPLVVAVGRVALPPGAAIAATTPTGARLIAAEAGTVTVGVVGNGVMRPPAGAQPLGGPPPGPTGQTRLRPGSALTVPAEVIREVRNDGAEAAVALDVAVFPAGARPLAPAVNAADGVTFTLLAGGHVVEAPAGPVQIFLRRVALPPRRPLPAGLGEGIALFHVEAGAAILRPIAGRIVVREARRPAIGPSDERRLDIGAEVALRRGGSAFVPQAAMAEVRGAPTGATLLVLTVHPSVAQPLSVAEG